MPIPLPMALLGHPLTGHGTVIVERGNLGGTWVRQGKTGGLGTGESDDDDVESGWEARRRIQPRQILCPQGRVTGSRNGCRQTVQVASDRST
ncbi:hypothetical protein IE53DRAFT_16027 [Violaceomyces palustris]|uniref:Uncharacterized protein n=1 Tax=Violaceomyces palustris TaxID=1673888 RepID=A0ACD0NLH9_9BASI|nr:hypothetical protein IE53DRAFT_16027 [Violaceomyces palustris]